MWWMLPCLLCAAAVPAADDGPAGLADVASAAAHAGGGLQATDMQGWHAGPVTEEWPTAPAEWRSAPTIDSARHIGYGWTWRRGTGRITVSVGATEYVVPLDAEASPGPVLPTALPAVRLGWRHQLSPRSGIYAAADALGHADGGGRIVPLRRARLGFEWSPFKGSRLGIAHGGLRIKFDDQSRMLLKVRRSSFSAYWQAKF